MFVRELPTGNYFGSYLKFLRRKLGLSQQQTSVMLNITNVELANVDVVAISRWERGIILPNHRRQIKVLRALTTDISPYITMLAKYKGINILNSDMEKYLNLRYNSPTAVISNISYEKKSSDAYIEHKIKSTDKEFVKEIVNFHRQISPSTKSNLDLFSLTNIIDYMNDFRLFAFKYTINDELCGHKIGLFFRAGVLEGEVNRILNNELSINDINLKLSKPLNSKEPFTYFSVSQYSNNEHVMRRQIYKEFSMLVKNVNIHHYYCTVIFEHAMELMIKVGFNVIRVEEKNPNGAIFFRGEKYNRALLHISTCNLLLNKDFIYMFTRCGTCFDRYCSSCPFWKLQVD
ncbi:TPA: hypothetical protein L3N00_004233 [Vibrio parahaemolyticus]|nr:hypothetical protein [Vibrio parahaemolyticus]HAV1327694.1 hypothetical protein [Vibrio parahaemolyticus]HBN6271656.1 hypothetical protein [Vibrio parahaemolyticus]